MSDTKTQAIDIGRRQVAGVYAKALLGAAQSAKATDLVLEELSGFVLGIVNKQPKFKSLLESPRVKSEEKVAILDKTLKGRMSETTLRFIKVVCEHDRLDCLNEIFDETKRLFNESQGVLPVKITTAEAIDSQVVSAIRTALKEKFKRPLDLEMTVDSKIVGGVIVQVGDKMYDGSVVQKLKNLREEAIEKTVKQMRTSTEKFATSS